MKKVVKKLAVCLSGLLMGCQLHAQVGLEIHAGTTMPLGSWAQAKANPNENKILIGAAPGFNAGISYTYPIGNSGLGIQAGVDFNMNGLQTSFKNDLKKDLDGAEISFHKFMNVPITAGINYKYKINKTVGIFTNAGLGMNIMKATDLTYNGQGYSGEITFKPTLAFAGKLGGGLLLFDRFTVGAHYCYLGAHAPEITQRVTVYGFSVQDQEKFDKENLHSLMISLGVSF